MYISKGRGRTKVAKIYCKKPTTHTTTSSTTTLYVSEGIGNCGPRVCNITCDEDELCIEDDRKCHEWPCCFLWSCKGTVLPPSPTTTPPAPTPPVPSSSTCCKERRSRFEQKFILVGKEESLPSCKNDCIYRKEDEVEDGQLYCFPSSYSDSLNQCDSLLIDPIPLIGFSTWSEWTVCRGDCRGGRSTRERRCKEENTDGVMCDGPTRQVRNCEVSCEADLSRQSGGCPREDVNVAGYPCTYHFVPDSSDWDSAQNECRDNFGGRLWEPLSEAEYAAVVSAVDSQTSASAASCEWWLGMFNWNDGSPDSEEAYLSSTVDNPPTTPPGHAEPIPRNGVISSFITVTDGNDLGTENCVHTLGWDVWWDANCTTGRPFICQACPPPCSCSFNNVSYPCGSLIKRNPHCCSEMVCSRQGIIEDIQVYEEENGMPESGCCISRARRGMIKDGEEFGPFWRRSVCCRGQILSRRWLWPLNPFPVKPVGSTLTISEGLETIVQENTYSNSSGILEIKVPAHKNYTDSVFLYHQDSGTSMLKTNNTCQVWKLPTDVLVSEMAKGLESLEKQNYTATETNTFTEYVVKARRKRYGKKKRQELLPKVQTYCQNAPLIETEDFIVNKTEFEKYDAGELIFIEEEKTTRRCDALTACVTQGPRACGHLSWVNPQTQERVSLHQVSDTSICVTCFRQYPGPDKCDGSCLCEKLTNKEEVMKCIVNDTDSFVEEDDDIIHQKLHVNKKADAMSISITSPAHKDLTSLEIVMHAATNGYWHGSTKNNHLVKVGNDCFVSTLPSKIFPIKIALGIQEIKEGNNVTGKQDEIETHGVIVGLQSLEDAEKDVLHSDIKARCSKSEIKDFKEINVTKDQSDELRKGNIIFFEDAKATKNSGCWIKSALTTKNNTSGCWRWPNPLNNEEVFVHHIVSSVISVACCVNGPIATCCNDDHPDICECDSITRDNFHTCLPPVKTGVFVADVSADGTELKVSQNFTYNREKGGSLKIEVEEHKHYEQSTLIFNETTMVLKNGNDHCAVFNGLPSTSSPSQVAIDADNLKTKLGKEIELENQLREDYVLIKSSETPKITESLNICANYYAAELMRISTSDFESMEAGNMIFVSKDNDISRSVDTCNLKHVCATNNGSSCFRIPTPGGATSFVHDVVSSPECIKCCEDGSDPNYCHCSHITDSSAYAFCRGPRPDALIVVSGVNVDSETINSVEILTRNFNGDYSPRGQKNCYVQSLPENTSSATGAVYNGLPTVCMGYYKKSEVSNHCYQLLTNGTWISLFQLENPLKNGGASILFHPGEDKIDQSWVFVGGDPDGKSTEVYENKTSYLNVLDLPTVMNLPCMVKINNTHGFVAAIPKYEEAPTNFAWILDRETQNWTRLPDTLESRFGPACGFLQNATGRFIVVAGGYKSDTTEVLNLDTFEWFSGPQLPNPNYGGSIVSVNDDMELLLIGVYDETATSQILRMNSSMLSWEYAGALENPRFDAVALAVPVKNLPKKFHLAC